MATVSKTQGISLINLQELSANQVLKSASQDVSTKLAATIFIHFALIDPAGSLSSGVQFRIEASANSSGNDQWFPLVNYTTFTAAPASEAVSGTVTSGVTIVPVGSTTDLNVGDIVFFKNSTIGNSEWGRIRSVSTDASITLIDALTNTQTGSTIYDLSEMFTAPIDLTAIGRIRVVADASNTSRNTVVQVKMVTGDSIS
tara:strand:+ start:19 stop:618 length:600 start_codon:yes stop_codon:yes gene_type:complete